MREDIPTALHYQTHNTENFGPIRKGSLYIVLSRTGSSDFDSSISRFQETQTRDRKAPHFVLGRSPDQLARMVDSSKRAWMSGADSKWKEFTNINRYAINIALCAEVGEGYTDEQYSILNRLIPHQMKNVIHNHNAELVLSHQDVRPWRHEGVGPEFEWFRLIKKGHAAPWKSIKGASTPWEALHEFGYRGSKRSIVTAFQTRFMASTITGKMDSLTEDFIMNCP